MFCPGNTGSVEIAIQQRNTGEGDFPPELCLIALKRQTIQSNFTPIARASFHILEPFISNTLNLLGC